MTTMSESLNKPGNSSGGNTGVTPAEARELLAITCLLCDVPDLAGLTDLVWNSRFTARMGDARWDARLGRGRIRLSRALWPRASRDEQVETIVHEACHVIAGFLHGPKQGHGPRWQELMRRCGYENPRRCHAVDEEAIRARRLAQRHRAFCGCPEGVLVTSVAVRRMQQGGKYGCRRCGQVISLTRRSEDPGPQSAR
jgi:predicted SprT family Zn-dependent metalloprotease